MKRRSAGFVAALGLLLAAAAVPAWAAEKPYTPGRSPAVPAAPRSAAQPAETMPGPLADVDFDQRLGERLPLDLRFRDETGATVRLGDYFGRRPVVLSFVYYGCPMLCGLVQSGLVTSLRAVDFDPGRDFDVVVVCFDHRETPAMAAEAKRQALGRYGRAGTDAGWHFLTGDEAAVRALTSAAGFRFVYDAARDEFAHAAGVLLVTPEGRLSRYLYGVEYPARDLRLGLVEASGEQIGTPVDQPPALLLPLRSAHRPVQRGGHEHPAAGGRPDGARPGPPRRRAQAARGPAPEDSLTCGRTSPCSPKRPRPWRARSTPSTSSGR